MTEEPPKVRLVLMSEELFQELGGGRVDWGLPVEWVVRNGEEVPVYSPTIYTRTGQDEGRVQ